MQNPYHTLEEQYVFLKVIMVSKLSDAIVKKLFQSPSTDLSLGQLNTLFNAKTYADLARFELDLNYENEQAVKLSKSLKTLLSGFAVVKLFEQQHEIQAVQNLHQAYTKMQHHMKKGIKKDILEHQLIDALVDGGLSYSLAKYTIIDTFKLAARSQEFELFILKQAQLLLLESLKNNVLSSKQIEFILNENDQSIEFQQMFPFIDERFIQLLTPTKTFHIFEPVKIGLISEEIQAYARQEKQNRRDAKLIVISIIREYETVNELRPLFDKCKAINENEALTTQEKSEKLSGLIMDLDPAFKHSTLSDIFLEDPFYVIRQIFHRATDDINKFLLKKMQEDPDFSKAFLEKIIISNNVFEFSEEILDFSIDSNLSGKTSIQIKKMAFNLLIAQKLQSENSPIAMAKLKKASLEQILEKLDISQNCIDRIMNATADYVDDLFHVQAQVNQKSKILIKEELLSQNFNCSDLKLIIDSYGKIYSKHSELQSIFDAELLSHFKHENMFDHDTLLELKERRMKQENIVNEIRDTLLNNTQTEFLYHLHDILNLDFDNSLSQKTTDLLSEIDKKIEERNLSLSVHSKEIAQAYANDKMKNMPRLHSNDIEKKVRQGKDRKEVATMYYDYYLKGAQRQIEEVVRGSTKGYEIENFIDENAQATENIFEIRRLEIQKKVLIEQEHRQTIEDVKQKLSQYGISTNEHDLSFIDTSEIKAISGMIKTIMQDRVCESMINIVCDEMAREDFAIELVKSILTSEKVEDLNEILLDGEGVSLLSREDIKTYVDGETINALKQAVIQEAKQKISEQIMGEYLNKDQIKLIISNKHLSVDEYAKTFPMLNPALFEVIDGTDAFNDAAQNYVADILDAKTKLELDIGTFRNKVQTNTTLANLFMLSGHVSKVSSLNVDPNMSDEAKLAEQSVKLHSILVGEIGYDDAILKLITEHEKSFVHKRVGSIIMEKINDHLLNKIDGLNGDDLEDIINATSSLELQDLNCTNELFSLAKFRIKPEVKEKAVVCLSSMEEIPDEIEVPSSSVLTIFDKLSQSDSQGDTDAESLGEDFSQDLDEEIQDELYDLERGSPDSVNSELTDRETPREYQNAFFSTVEENVPMDSKMTGKLGELKKFLAEQREQSNDGLTPKKG